MRLSAQDWRDLKADPARQPLYPHPHNHDWQGMRGWRLWWDDVKNGRKTFSFKGQKVEYRFISNGNWETFVMADPPDDAPGRPEAGEKSPDKHPKIPVEGQTRKLQSNFWVWVGGAVVCALLLAAAFAAKLKRA